MRNLLAYFLLGLGTALMISSCPTAKAGPSVQLEAGVVEMINPIDDQYVLYHGNGISSGTQMTSPVFGIALREDAGPVVLTAGFRDMGHQRIDTDIVPDATYLNCRYKGTCPPPMEHWTARMSLREFYASVGYKFHYGRVAIIPTFGLAFEKAPTNVEIDFPYEEINKYNSHYHAGHAPYFYPARSDTGTFPMAGVDFEYKHLGFGVYWLQTAIMAAQMNDPGIGQHGFLTRVTYRFGL